MKKLICFSVIAIGILIYCLLLPHEVSRAVGTVNSEPMTIKIISRSGKKLFVMYDDRDNEIYRRDMTEINPRTVKLCDIDGDGETEIFVMVKKRTPFHSEIENRPFFFNFKSNMLTRKWTGSKFGTPLVDVYFIDYRNDGTDTVFAVHKSEKGMNISAQYWHGFGFKFIGESDYYESIDDIKKSADGITALIDGQEVNMKISNVGGAAKIIKCDK